MKRLLLILTLSLAACGSSVPSCQEDAVLIGTGQFDNGRWSSYVCGPAVDDYTQLGMFVEEMS